MSTVSSFTSVTTSTFSTTSTTSSVNGTTVSTSTTVILNTYANPPPITNQPMNVVALPPVPVAVVMRRDDGDCCTPDNLCVRTACCFCDCCLNTCQIMRGDQRDHTQSNRLKEQQAARCISQCWRNTAGFASAVATCCQDTVGCCFKGCTLLADCCKGTAKCVEDVAKCLCKKT